jgi:tripartite-type tricarboxylate transporter receptor subunit TctC
MPDVPAEAVAAAERAIDAAMTDPEFRVERSAARLTDAEKAEIEATVDAEASIRG